MIQFEEFNRVRSSVRASAVTGSQKRLAGYLTKESSKDAYPSLNVLTAVRGMRRLQISLREYSDPPAAFFKDTGQFYEARLLHVIYSLDNVDESQAIKIYKSWIADLKSENDLEHLFPSLF